MKKLLTCILSSSWSFLIFLGISFKGWVPPCSSLIMSHVWWCKTVLIFINPSRFNYVWFYACKPTTPTVRSVSYRAIVSIVVPCQYRLLAAFAWFPWGIHFPSSDIFLSSFHLSNSVFGVSLLPTRLYNPIIKLKWTSIPGFLYILVRLSVALN